MKKAALQVKVLYFRTIPDEDRLRDILTAAAIAIEHISIDAWLNAKCPVKADALLLLLDRWPGYMHLFHTILDLGLPVLMLDYGNHHQPSFTPSTNMVLSWPSDKNRLANTLYEISKRPLPVPLCVPKINGIGQLNTLSIYGISSIFLKTIKELHRFSCSLAPVLLQGETGTGKELGARALHYLGPHKAGPFVPVNCSNLPDTLFENELFGHSKGAYTGAQDNYSGLLSHANGGTLFFDEIDSLQPRAQAGLLRVLQDRQYRPLGSSKLLRCDTSIVAASNQDLKALVREGRFREDLLYRINTITLNFPPLRQRPEDITLLARVFLRKLCKQYHQAPKSFHPDTFKWLEAQSWPGNVRELENCVHRGFLLSETPFVRIGNELQNEYATDKPWVKMPEQLKNFNFKEMRDGVIHDFEVQYLHKLMIATKGNVSLAARLANKERRCLGKLLKKHGINREEYRVDNTGDSEDDVSYEYEEASTPVYAS